MFAPATVANVACGFDILGFALRQPGDEMHIALSKGSGITIQNRSGEAGIPSAPGRNTAGVALRALLGHVGSRQGFRITLLRKIKPGSGLGSSAASSAAAVFGANELLGRPLSARELVPFAMEGERLASGTAHADNVAPALLGGFTLIRSYDPPDIIPVPYPAQLFCTVVHPQIEVRTEDTRKILRKEVQLKDAITQWGNIAGLVAGLMLPDFGLIGRSLRDVIIEPTRSILIPGYDAVKEKVMANGALGCSISGSGPSIFALSANAATAKIVAREMQSVFEGLGIENQVHVSQINPRGARRIKER